MNNSFLGKPTQKIVDEIFDRRSLFMTSIDGSSHRFLLNEISQPLHYLSSSTNKTATYPFSNDEQLSCISNLIEVNDKNGSIQYVDDNSFNGCSNLSSVYFPNVLSIGKSCFLHTDIREANFPNLISCDYNAFGYCINLSNVILPRLQSLSQNMFSNCYSLTSINLENVKTDNSYGKLVAAFYCCSSLMYANLPNITTATGTFRCIDTRYPIPLLSANLHSAEHLNQTFFRCYELSAVDCTNVKTIGSRTFFECTSLSSLYCPYVKTIEDHAFDYCSKLSSLECPEVSSIGECAFEACHSMISADFESVLSIGDKAFYNCDNLSSLNCLSVKYIGTNAFYACPLTSLECPNLISVGFRQFANMPTLISADFRNAEILSTGAFLNAFNLTSINLHNTLSAMPGALAICSSLVSVDCENIQYVGSSVFAGCNSLKSLYLPKCKTFIGNGVGYTCSSLTSIYCPSCDEYFGLVKGKNLKVINLSSVSKVPETNYGSKFDSDYLISCYIPYGMTNQFMADNSWKYHYDGSELVFIEVGVPDTKLHMTSTIGNTYDYSEGDFNSNRKQNFYYTTDSGSILDQFKVHSDLSSPNCLKKIVDNGNVVQQTTYNSFLNCINLTDVDLLSTTYLRSWSLKGCTNLSSINLPMLEKVGQNAFDGCSNLTSIYLPNVKTLKENAFNGNSTIENVICPNVTTIENMAFLDGQNIKTINISSMTLDNLTALSATMPFGRKRHWEVSVYVPTECIPSLNADTQWYNQITSNVITLIGV